MKLLKHTAAVVATVLALTDSCAEGGTPNPPANPAAPAPHGAEPQGKRERGVRVVVEFKPVLRKTPVEVSLTVDGNARNFDIRERFTKVYYPAYGMGVRATVHQPGSVTCYFARVVGGVPFGRHELIVEGGPNASGSVECSMATDPM